VFSGFILFLFFRAKSESRTFSFLQGAATFQTVQVFVTDRPMSAAQPASSFCRSVSVERDLMSLKDRFFRTAVVLPAAVHHDG
jgi:hypothetical protein